MAADAQALVEGGARGAFPTELIRKSVPVGEAGGLR